MKKILLWLVMAALLAGCVSAAYSETNYSISYRSSSARIQLTQLKYEPYPVNPGEYFDLWIKVQNTGTSPTENATFELMPEYPFSLDSNENALRNYGELHAEPAVFHYKVRVDKDAVEGTNKLKLRYRTDNIYEWLTISFDIEVSEARTDFDVVVQEINGNEVSVAIANIGKNNANSVVVRVPEQEYFEATGTSGQMVGNLEAGDYTLVSFEITGKGNINNFNPAGNLRLKVENNTNVKVTAEKDNPSVKKMLKFQIDYTDAIGERRSLFKEVPFSSENSDYANMTSSMARRFSAPSQKSLYTSWWFWVIVIAVLCAGWAAYKKYRKKKEQKEEKKRR